MGASPQMVDWDEDGDMDLLVGEYDGHVHFFMNVGTVTNPILTDRGHLMVGASQIDVSQLAIPVVNDWDEDGRKDLIVGNDNADIKLFMNTGTNNNPVFSTTQYLDCSPAISQIKNAPDIGDLNGDGLKDLAFGWWQGTVVFYPNTGTNANPVFDSDYELTALGTPIDPGGWTHLELNDWDEDGDLDLVYGEWDGEVYIHLNISNELEANLTPSGAPITIPETGGSFEFSAEIVNHYSGPINADVWLVAKLPDGSETGALAQATMNLASGAQVNGDLSQRVPASAPSGDYEHILRWGSYPYQPWAEASFPFTKLGDDDGVVDLSQWFVNGELFEEDLVAEVSAPSSFILNPPHPNPFNPTTTFSFALPEASSVILRIYNLNGQMLETVFDGARDAGSHNVTYDASHLSSGVYLYQITAGEYSASGKMVLMK